MQQLNHHPFYESRQRRSTYLANIHTVDAQELLTLSLGILNREPAERMQEELTILQAATQNIKFCQSILQEQGQVTLLKCLKAMRLAHYSESTIVFERGDKGDTFYIILTGQVGVYVYSNQEISPSQAHSQIKQKKVYFSNYNVEAMIRSKQLPNSSQPLQVRKQLLQPRIRKLLKVNQLISGDSFGERALINDAPRLATLVCETDCFFGMLTKQEYSDILQAAQSKQIEQQIIQLQEHSGFRTLSQRLLYILLYAFQNSTYSFRDVVYKEGQPSNDEIYLIKEGEFMLSTSQCVMSDDGIDKYNSKVAILQRGSIFGDLEAFKQIPYRKYTVVCNSFTGSVLCIQLNELHTRLQASNELHLYDDLQSACHKNEHRRSSYKQSLNSHFINYKKYIHKNTAPKCLEIQLPTPILMPQVPFQRNRTSTQPDIRSPIKEEQIKNSMTNKSVLEQVSDVVKNKQILFRKLNNQDPHQVNKCIFNVNLSPPRRSQLIISTKSQSVQGRRYTMERVLHNSRISKRLRADLVNKCNSYMSQEST